MDSVTKDPELAQEMARLLHKKLQKARRERDELRESRQYEGLLMDSSALQSENERLQNELAKMQLDLSVTLKNDSEDYVVNKLPKTTPDTAESVEEKQRDVEEQAAGLQGLADKARAYKMKHKEAKIKKVVLEERRLRDLESELGKIQAMTEDSFDTSLFLSTAVEVPGCPAAGLPRSFPPHMLSNFKSESGILIAVLSKDVLWHENLNRAIILAPSMQYDPTKHSGTGSWSKTSLHQLFRVDGSTHVHVIYQNGSNCYYHGTYSTLWASPISVAEAQKISYAATLTSVAPLDANIYTMQEENMRLQQELRELAQRRIQPLEEYTGEHMTSLEFDAPSQGVNATAEDDETKTRLGVKVSARKAKYRRTKSKNAALKETIAGLEVLIQEAEEEQGLASERLQTAEAELSVQPWSPQEFLNALVIDATTASSITVITFHSGKKVKLPENVDVLCDRGGFMTKNHNEIVWADEMKTHCMAISPTYRYNPKAGSGDGGWETLFDMKRQPGEEMEMFYMNERKDWQYVGTYHCVGKALLPPHKVEKFATTTHVTYAIDKTILFRENVPMIIKRAVKQMYTVGVLQVACTGWQRVGFNRSLGQALRTRSVQTIKTSPGSPAKRNRQRDDEETKKRKKRQRT
ncbi:hypothetical protein L227DRAFT_651319 [Lentinus tigrinus ALCF2SS1-6]|uniref:Uncharacterized protein n=1 Tax=Lentinus tigrinus ALCF2SS1-6 TaxID=1328759 RepID=A0A5C2SH03_9APHY|nr:hypothetical protein L227DRAFT_651319 [Lentinus tigrinus ALCF2SS1-6]